MGLILDETVDLEKDMASGPSGRNSEWEESQPILRKVKMSGTYNYRPAADCTDAVYDKLLDSFYQNDPIYVLFTDGDINDSGHVIGVKAPMQVAKLGQSRNIGDRMQVQIELVGTVDYEDDCTPIVPERYEINTGSLT